jgi:hypothetical protein
LTACDSFIKFFATFARGGFRSGEHASEVCVEMRGGFCERARRLLFRPTVLGDQKRLDPLSHFPVQTRQTTARRRLVHAEHRARFAQAQIIEVVELD